MEQAQVAKLVDAPVSGTGDVSHGGSSPLLGTKMSNDQFYKWIMSITFLGSALLLSSNFEYSRIGFMSFFAGHLIGLYVFRRDPAMLWHNILFSFIDLWGIYRWWF
jgi:hypothetical protein